MSTKRSVIQRGCPAVNEDGTASETINPGYLVKGISTIAKQTATTGGFALAVALERDELGAGIDNAHQGSGTGSAFYASGDRVKVGVFRPGDRFVGYVASGQNIAEDDLLESAGNGLFAEGATRPVVRACETIGAVTVTTAVVLEVL